MLDITFLRQLLKQNAPKIYNKLTFGKYDIDSTTDEFEQYMKEEDQKRENS